MFGQNYKALPIEDFSGGLKTRGGPFYRSKPGVMTTPNCNGVYSTTGKTLKRMNGYTKITSSQKTGTGNGVYNYAVTATSFKQMVQFGTVMYKIDGYDGTLDSLQTGVSDDRAEFDTFIDASGNQTLLYANHSKDTLRSWNGSAGTMTTISGAPRGKFVKVWNSIVWVFNLFNAPNEMKYSAVNDITSYPALNVEDGFGTSEGDEITGVEILRGRMFVFKKNNIFRMTYNGGVPLYTLEHLISGTGAITSHSIQSGSLLIRTQEGVQIQEVLIFMTAEKRLVAFDGTYILPISEAIEDDNGQSAVSIPLINETYIEKCHAVYQPEKHQYMIFVPVSSASAPSHMLSYDTYSDGLFPCDNNAFEACGMVRDTNSKLVPVALMNGYLYQLDLGNTQDGTAINAFYDLDVIDYDQNSTLKKGGHFEITTRLTSATTLRVQHRNDWDASYSSAKNLVLNGGDRLGQTFVLGTSKLGGPRAGNLTYPFPFLVNNTQLRISDTSTNSGPFEVYKVDFVAAGLGRAKA